MAVRDPSHSLGAVAVGLVNAVGFIRKDRHAPGRSNEHGSVPDESDRGPKRTCGNLAERFEDEPLPSSCWKIGDLYDEFPQKPTSSAVPLGTWKILGEPSLTRCLKSAPDKGYRCCAGRRG